MTFLPLACLLFVGVQSVAEVPNPRPDGWVTDQANVIDPADEAALTANLYRLNASSGAEVVVVTVDDVPATPKEFATALFNGWHLGDAARNDGVLVLLVVGQRRLEIETGVGIETALPAWWLSELQADLMVPHFKRGDLSAGLVAGVDGIRARLGDLPGEAERAAAPGEYRSGGVVAQAAPGAPVTAAPAPGAPPPTSRAPSPATSPPPPASRSSGSRTVAVVAVVAILALLAGIIAFIVRTFRRRRRCVPCAVTMLSLDELADDAHLSPGQLAEERVGSVNHEVLICPGCQTSKILHHDRWFSGRSRCSACAFKTSKRTSRTLTHATYDHGGSVEITEICAHCNRHDVRTRSTPRRTRPSPSTSSSTSSRSSYSSSSSSRSSSSSSSRSSSSSSSSRSSGGSSRGGGAGSSW